MDTAKIGHNITASVESGNVTLRVGEPFYDEHGTRCQDYIEIERADVPDLIAFLDQSLRSFCDPIKDLPGESWTIERCSEPTPS